MPTYEYACKECGEHLEVVQSFKDDALTVCPACAGTLRKVFSAAGIIFKGSGWHVKDYSSSSRPSTGSGAGGDDAPEGAATKKDAGDKDTSSSKDTSAGTSSTSETSSSGDKGSKTSSTAGSGSTSKSSAGGSEKKSA